MLFELRNLGISDFTMKIVLGGDARFKNKQGEVFQTLMRFVSRTPMINML